MDVVKYVFVFMVYRCFFFNRRGHQCGRLQHFRAQKRYNDITKWYVLMCCLFRNRICAFFALIAYIDFALYLEVCVWGGGEGVPLNRINSAIFVCLSQARTWISIIICCGHGLFVFNCQLTCDRSAVFSEYSSFLHQ